MTQPFRDNPKLARVIHMLNKACTILMYAAYPLLLIYMLLNKEEGFLRALLVPAISFVVLSVGRHLLNRPRPYEVFGVPPVIKKDTKGNSFPSRHVFSATMIAMTFLLMSPWSWLGVLFLAICLLLAVVRVVSGVHFISDVLAGFFVGVLAAVIGYLL